MEEIPDTLQLGFSAIEAIYQAGVKRGNDEATAYDHGSMVIGKHHDELVDALHDILNEGIKWGEPGYRDYSAVQAYVVAAALRAKASGVRVVEGEG